MSVKGSRNRVKSLEKFGEGYIESIKDSKTVVASCDYCHYPPGHAKCDTCVSWSNFKLKR